MSDALLLLLALAALLAMRLLLVGSGWLVRILIVVVWLCLMAVAVCHVIH